MIHDPLHPRGPYSPRPCVFGHRCVAMQPCMPGHDESGGVVLTEAMSPDELADFESSGKARLNVHRTTRCDRTVHAPIHNTDPSFPRCLR